jgi:hypothetical protein
VSRLRKTPQPFRWTAIPIAFTQGTAASVNLASYLSNPQARTITYSTVGTLPTGVTLAGSTVSYNGTAVAATVSVRFRASSGTYEADSDLTTVSIAPVVGNSDPVWLTPTNLGTITANTPFSFTLTAADPDSDPISFIVGALPGAATATPQTQSGTTRGIVVAGTGLSAGTYTFTINADDEPPLGQVTGLLASAASSSAIGLSWTSVSAATRYEVQRSLTGVDAWTSLGTVTTTSRTDTGLQASTQYFYRVRAENATQVGEFSAAASATTLSVSANADQDWIARSNYQGVVWAHDFRYAEEGTAFVDIPTDLTQIDPDARPAGYSVGGAICHNIPGNPFANLVSIEALTNSTARITVESSIDLDIAYPVHDEWVRICCTWGDSTGSSPGSPSSTMPSPFSLLHDKRNGGGGETMRWKVIAIHSPTVFDIETINSPSNLDGNVTTLVPGAFYFGQTDGTLAGTDVVQRARVAQGGWTRLFSAFQSGHGLPVPDRGLTAPEFTQSANPFPARVYPAWSTNRDNDWRKDYYGHSIYTDRLDNWPDRHGNPQTDNYRGSDFWIQWRVKIEGTRYQASTDPMRNHLGLKYFGIWNAGPTPRHEVVWSDLNVQPCPPASVQLNENLPASAGGFVGGYTGASVTQKFYADSGAQGSQMQRGGDFTNCILGRNNAWADEAADCFRIPPDEWVTFLCHVTPGLHHPAGSSDPPTGWPTAADITKGTGIQLWGATQSRIDSMRNAGLEPTYQCIYNKVGATAFPFTFNGLNGDGTDNTDLSKPINAEISPPAWNEIRYWAYQNFIPQLFAYRRWMTQLIFKKGIGIQNEALTTTSLDPHVDGIPCPRY